MSTALTLEQLAQRFRPLYVLHSEEMWYPCHPEDQLRCADLVRIADGSTVIPALGDADGSPADQLLCTPVGLKQLGERGIELAADTIAELQMKATPSEHYGALLAAGPSTPPSFILRRADSEFMPPYGFIESANFSPPHSTWFNRGAPNNPLNWLGGDPSTYAPAILAPPPGVMRGSWQEPTTAAWVQPHSVAGVDYVDIIYTVMLAWNGSISLVPGQGEHPNDVETIVVRFAAEDLDHPVRYMFQQHGGYCWYDPDHIELDGERVRVYLARESHECYPGPGRFARLYGIGDDVCDDRGVTWDAPVMYADRPQGIDGHGVDVDALRLEILRDDPGAVVLVPFDVPGPLWPYVRFQYFGRGPSGVSLTDVDLTYQALPLFTPKWWPGEGPAGSVPPLSTIAANPSAAGVPDDFFANAASYLGADPMPGAGSTPVMITEPTSAGMVACAREPATGSASVSGSQIGGSSGLQAPDAPFVDWRGPIGGYLLCSIDSYLPSWLRQLPDPLTVAGPAGGDPRLETLTVVGLSGLAANPVRSMPPSPTDIQVHASCGPLACTAVVSFAGVPVPVSATVSSLTLDAVARLVTPVALPTGDDPEMWYVPYVGPLPYSYVTQPAAATWGISSATITRLGLTAGTISVDVNVDDPALELAIDVVIDGALGVIEPVLEPLVSFGLQEEVNALLKSVYSGATRF
ncbi:MAG TPA: hypothetical protein VF549_08205 [Solirubrobacteraceae bacterium]|jgi:hypothetical protein